MTDGNRDGNRDGNGDRGGDGTRTRDGDLSWASHDFGEDTYRLLSRYADEPLVYDSRLKGWLVLRHADIVDILRSTDYAKNPAKALDGPYTDLQRAMAGSSMMFMDDPDRRRVRGLIGKAFTNRRVAQMRPRIEAIAARLLDAVAGQDSFDLMTAYAMPLSISVIASLLGVDDADWEQFKEWSEDLALEYDPWLSDEARERIAGSRNELVMYFIGQIDARTSDPREDLVTWLLRAQSEDDRLSYEELLSTLVMLLVAGNLTTTDLIGNGVLALLEHPEQLALLRDDPALLPNTVEEILRYDSPVTVTDRIATADLTIAGCPVHKGEWIWPALVAGNHDPARHKDPDRFDITRENPEHVSFGVGSHICLGAPLARLEAQIGIATLLERYPTLALDPAMPPTRRSIPAFRGVERLVVRG